jgi:hypothetical protein
MYGVHGIDDNPLANPLGDATQSCNTCETDADCGASGNVCVRLNSDEKVCAIECLHDAGCGEGQTCRQFGSSSTGYIKGRACVPKTLSCGNNPPPPPTDKEFKASGEVQRDERKFFSVPVGRDARNIKVTMTGTNDADLYTGFDTAPTQSDWTCRPYKNGSSEVCSHTSSNGESLEIMVRGWASGTSTFDLHVTWE